jgi:hypothetical protein
VAHNKPLNKFIQQNLLVGLGLLVMGIIPFLGTTAMAEDEISAPSSNVWDHATTEVVRGNSAKWSSSITGIVTKQNGAPIKDAVLAFDGQVVKTDMAGHFSLVTKSSGNGILIQKPGFRKALIMPITDSELKIQLKPLSINALYIGDIALDNAEKMRAIGDQLQTTEINTNGNPISERVGRYVKIFHRKGVYTIARIVTFNNAAAVRHHPELGIQDVDGGPWKGKKGSMFLNPYMPEARRYVVDIAIEAAKLGFDEIQFDYVRFPSDGPLARMQFGHASNSDTRTAAISSFLREARTELQHYGVFIAADVFGDTAFVRTDSGIGQRIEDITKYLDFVCPMVYPSGYADNTGNLGNPVDHPKEIVELSIRRYRLRADPDTVIRPWLQSFTDYAFKTHKPYHGAEVMLQVQGSEVAGGNGYLLWNAGGTYHLDGVTGKRGKALAGN